MGKVNGITIKRVGKWSHKNDFARSLSGFPIDLGRIGIPKPLNGWPGSLSNDYIDTI